MSFRVECQGPVGTVQKARKLSDWRSHSDPLAVTRQGRGNMDSTGQPKCCLAASFAGDRRQTSMRACLSDAVGLPLGPLNIGFD